MRGAESGLPSVSGTCFGPARLALDNLEAHQAERVRQAIEARGTSLWFLPAYLPDWIPIVAFPKPRALLCRAAARTREALADTIRAALNAITPQGARRWCAHCGYPVPDQDL